MLRGMNPVGVQVMSKRLYNKAGLSFPEILFMLSIALVAASVLIPTYLSLINNKKSKIGYAQMKVLFSAAKQMNNEYRIWPSYKASDKSDVQYGENLSNVYVMNMLMAIDGEGNTGHINNPSRINFIEMASDGDIILEFNDLGEVVDPWGMPFQFVFDANYNNICTTPGIAQGSILGTGVAIWSYGPDRTSDTKDDLSSWERVLRTP